VAIPASTIVRNDNMAKFIRQMISESRLARLTRRIPNFLAKIKVSKVILLFFFIPDKDAKKV
jgi:hypothetical protein